MLDLRNAKVVVTGGAGFIGHYTVNRLLAEGAQQITVIDNLVRGSQANIAEALQTGKVTLVQADIRDRELLNYHFGEADYCFHLAALRITQCAEQPREAFEVMYEGTFNVLEACVSHEVKKLVAASSASIYGGADAFPTTEQHHPYNNRTLYGAAKLANEQMMRAFNDLNGLNYVALRYFNVYGPFMDIHGKYTEVLIRWYRLVREGKPPLIFGDGTQTMDFVFVDDVARANIQAMKSEASDSVYNVGSQTETSLAELCNLLLETMGTTLEPQYVPLPEDRKAVEVPRRLAETSRAAREIDFVSSVSLEDGLSELVAWLDAQEPGGQP